MHHTTIRRYTLIIEKISRRQYPSFCEIRDFLGDHDFRVSDRTIQRDIEQIRVEFGLEITYDRHRNGYFINEDLSFNIEGFLRFLEIVNTAELLTESLKESRNALNYIAFDAAGHLRNIACLKPLLQAVREHRRVRFDHENFETGLVKPYLLEPYLLKEYLNRWYLVGRLEKSDTFWNFGIDRIHNLRVEDEVFVPDPKADPASNFRDIIGLTYSVGLKESVELSFTPLQGKYVKALPLHHSQEILSDGPEGLHLRLRLIPNLEFRQRILMLGPNVKVLSPAWLVDDIRQMLQAAAAQY